MHAMHSNERQLKSTKTDLKFQSKIKKYSDFVEINYLKSDCLTILGGFEWFLTFFDSL